ncbi:hypothetical protein MFLAVUS_010031 [Mucor flavus]|uniref:Uncharacterized protein n=1 Tax=Mucor flavus TaxID=439312 RepID=A0ABP9ZBJ9_9FUNG
MHDIEKEPLTAPQEWASDTSLEPALSTVTPSRQNSEILNVLYFKTFETIADNVIFNINECQEDIEVLKEAHKTLYLHTPNTNKIARKNRSTLTSQTIKLDNRLQYLRKSVVTLEPSKPKLSDLDLRNQKYKLILRSYKDLLEKYINITLESQRYTAQLFEKYIKTVNPHATPFDLERAIASTGEDSPSVFVQVLMQRGVRRNDKEVQHMMHIVQDMHGDLRQLASTFTKLSEMRNEVNILIERYRRRWPLVLKEGDMVYVIDDELNVLERTQVGNTIDFDGLLRKREKRNKLIASLVALFTVIVIITIVASTTLFTDF